MLPGDLCTMSGEGVDDRPAALDTLGVDVGGKVLGWHRDRPEGLAVVEVSPDAFTGAWRAM